MTASKPLSSTPEVAPHGITAATRLQAGGSDLDGGAAGDGGEDRRGSFRNPVEAVRSIGLMLLDDTGYPASPWLVADVLDVSCSGLCLLVFERPDAPFLPRFRVRLNVSMHPDFGVPELGASLRWFVRAGLEHVVTLGVQFDRELPRPPILLACRRNQPRVLGQ